MSKFHKVPRRIQRAERERLVAQGLRAGLGIVSASQQAAQFVRRKYGCVQFRGDEAHYLYELGLDCVNRGPFDRDYPYDGRRTPIVRGHRGRQ